jgi:hypothetical protein
MTAFLDDLTATVELAVARSVLRRLIALAQEAPELSDDQLRDRLVDLAGMPRRVIRAMSRSADPPAHQ